MDNHTNNESMVCNDCSRETMCHANRCGNDRTKYYHSVFLRLILGIIILMIVFSLGVKIGEFKGMFENENYNMRQYENYPPRSMMLNQRIMPVNSPLPSEQ